MTNSLLSPDDLSFIDTLFATFFARKQAPGLTYGVTYKGHVVHARALGHRTLSPLEPVSTTTPFRIASMTKSFAAAALLQLRNEGRVSLEASVQSAVPKIPLTSTWLDFLRAGGSPNSTYERVLSSSARREMQGSYSWMAPTTFTRNEDNSTGTDYPSYGYGLRNEVIDGLHYSGHSGGIPGYGSHMRINLETGFGVVAFGNGTYCPTYEVCREALDFIARKTFRPGTLMQDAAQRLAERLAKHILAGGDSCDEELFIPTMRLDYPPQEFIRDAKQKLQKLGEQASITIGSISASSGALGQVVLAGANGAATLQFGIAPFGVSEKIQSVKWIEPF